LTNPWLDAGKRRLATGRPAWRMVALAGVAVSAPVIGLAPARAVAGLVVDGVVLILVDFRLLTTEHRFSQPRECTLQATDCPSGI
jgi:hypothetical protein